LKSLHRHQHSVLLGYIYIGGGGGLALQGLHAEAADLPKMTAAKNTETGPENLAQ